MLQLRLGRLFALPVYTVSQIVPRYFRKISDITSDPLRFAFHPTKTPVRTTAC
jgi:hypothetical protein